MDIRKLYIFVGVTATFVVIISVLLILWVNSKQPAQQPPYETRQLTPTPQISIQPKQPPIPYYSQGQEKLLDYIQNRRKLIPSDQQTRNHLIQMAGNSGLINTTNDYQLTYIQAADAFMGEIRTPDVVTAKQEINSWLESQGMSQEGICYLPLSLYISPALSKVGMIGVIPFSPLPLGC